MNKKEKQAILDDWSTRVDGCVYWDKHYLEYLIRQLDERDREVKELKEELYMCNKGESITLEYNDKLRVENQRLRKALEEIEQQTHWIDSGEGDVIQKIARQALAGKEKG